MKKAKPRHVDAMLDSAMGKGKAPVDPLTKKFKNESKEERYQKGREELYQKGREAINKKLKEDGELMRSLHTRYVAVGETDDGYEIQTPVGYIEPNPKFIIRDDAKDLEVE